MHGVVSLLDDEHYEAVQALWSELEAKLGARDLYRTPFPHFSYQVAKDYDVEALEPALRRFASNIATFRVKTAGLGIFSGAQTVLYLPVVRDAELSRLHKSLWQELASVGAGVVDYYRPEMWMPHITLADGNSLTKYLPDIIALLSGREFNWNITIDNFSLIYDTGIEQEIKFRVGFGDK